MNVRTMTGPALPATRTLQSPPKEELIDQVKTEARQTAEVYAQNLGTIAGGTLGTTALVGGLYAGVLGGAAVGAAFGGGFGPMVAAVGSSGALDFIATSFGAAGVAVKAGMVIGGLATAAGAWTVGEKVGRRVGRVPGKAAGYVVGAAKGSVHNLAGIPSPLPAKTEDTEGPNRVRLSRPLQVVATAVSGVGLVSGLVGGALVGAGLLATGQLATGLLAQNLTWAAVQGAAGVGAIVGGAGLGLAGAVGGWQFVKGIKAAVSGSETAQRWLFTTGKEDDLARSSLELDKLRGKLGSREAGLEQLKIQRAEELNGKEQQVDQLQDEVRFKREQRADIVGHEAQQVADREAQQLGDLRGELSARELDLDRRSESYAQARADLDGAIQERGQELVTELRAGFDQELSSTRTEVAQKREHLQAIKEDPEAAFEALVRQEFAPILGEIEEAKGRTLTHQAEKDELKQRATEETRRSEELEGEIARTRRETNMAKVEVRRMRSAEAVV